METESPLPPNSPPEKGLPPVVPVSARHLIQLFVVPAFIVAVAVLILLTFSWLVGGPRTPQQFLDSLESTNPDIRWRAANDLAQVLKRDDQLAADPRFGLQLAEILRKTLDECEREEKDLADREPGLSKGDREKERKALKAKQTYTLFLTACLGNLALPTGVPLLTEMAEKGRSKDPQTRALFRRRAVWALASLGDSLGRFDRLTPFRQREAIHLLLPETAPGQPRGEWARLSLRHVFDKLSAEEQSQLIEQLEDDIIQDAWRKAGRDRPRSEPPAQTRVANPVVRQSLGVIATLARCAEDEDVFLREMTGFALTFWQGQAAENALAEKTLLRLARDDGHGTRIEIKEGD